MTGRKFKKDKNEIRYHRVDLGYDDDLDDDETKLNRDLGPPKKRRNCGKLIRGIFIVCTVLLTLAGLVSVVAYTAILYPEGPTKQFHILYNKVFGPKETNATSVTTNPNSTTAETSTLAINITVNANITNGTFTQHVTTTDASVINKDHNNKVLETKYAGAKSSLLISSKLRYFKFIICRLVLPYIYTHEILLQISETLE